MSDMYCEYRGARYKIKKRKGEYIVTSRQRKEGFINYIDVLGNEHSDLYMKNVKVNDVDVIYTEDVFVKYKTVNFQLFEDKITRNAVQENSYMIWTASEQLAYDYGFEKKEQFVFVKYITKEDIEAVKIVKKPILDFKDIEQSEEILEGNQLDNWLSKLI